VLDVAKINGLTVQYRDCIMSGWRQSYTNVFRSF